MSENHFEDNVLLLIDRVSDARSSASLSLDDETARGRRRFGPFKAFMAGRA